jgi:hypothetical protein
VLPQHAYLTQHRQQALWRAMEELMPEAKQIYDLLKISTKEVVKDHFNAYRS